MKLYNYWRSSTSYRVRIALNLKGVAYDYIPVNLLKDEQNADAYLALNPSGGVPTLIVGDRESGIGNEKQLVIAQSLAILDYLQQTFPEPPLLPKDVAARARALQIAYIVACDMHQFANLPVLNYVAEKIGEDQKSPWVKYWFEPALAAIDKILSLQPPAPFCVGDVPGIADICLIPALYTARRFGVDLAAYSRIRAIESHCLAHPAFAAAHPDNQPDAVKA